MKRFIVPAIFVVDLYDNEGEEMALEVATRMQEAANRAVLARTIQPPHCMLDEELPIKEVPVNAEETEIPGTYNTPEIERGCGETVCCDDPNCPDKI